LNSPFSSWSITKSTTSVSVLIFLAKTGISILVNCPPNIKGGEYCVSLGPTHVSSKSESLLTNPPVEIPVGVRIFLVSVITQSVSSPSSSFGLRLNNSFSDPELEIYPVLLSITSVGGLFSISKVNPSITLVEGVNSVRAIIVSEVVNSTISKPEVFLKSPEVDIVSKKLTWYCFDSSIRFSDTMFTLALPVPSPVVKVLRSVVDPPKVYPSGFVLGTTTAAFTEVPVTLPAKSTEMLKVFS